MQYQIRFIPFSFVICAALNGAAQAQDPQMGQIIWSDVRTGMTKEQVLALHPKGRAVDLGNGCAARFSAGYQEKRAVDVTLDGDQIGCELSVRASLIAKYGEARTDEVNEEDSSEGRTWVGANKHRYIRLRQLGLDGNDPLDTVRVMTWFTGDTLITLRLNETLKEWSVRYQPARITKPVLTDKL